MAEHVTPGVVSCDLFPGFAGDSFCDRSIHIYIYFFFHLPEDVALCFPVLQADPSVVCFGT